MDIHVRWPSSQSAQLPTAPTNQPPGRLRKKDGAQAAGQMERRGTGMDLIFQFKSDTLRQILPKSYPWTDLSKWYSNYSWRTISNWNGIPTIPNILEMVLQLLRLPFCSHLKPTLWAPKLGRQGPSARDPWYLVFHPRPVTADPMSLVKTLKTYWLNM